MTDVSASLLSSWDWRTLGVVSPVGNQGHCGSCYAFASIGNIESKLRMDGAGIYDFSENNAKECNWRELNHYEYPPGSPWGSCDGGNYFMLASLFSQRGTVLEPCDPYVDRDVSCKTTCPYNKTLLDWRIISGDGMPSTNVLKTYIQTYGPVHTTMYAGGGDAWETEFGHYDGSYTLHYPGTESTNHEVLIVGWDDDLRHAAGTGGWIVKNSWGTGWGGTCGYGTERGYFTIAYGSASIGKFASFMYAWQDYDENGDILYYDEDGGWWSAWGCRGSTTGWGLCKFIPPRDTYVTRVEFWTTDRTTDVDVYVYEDFDGTAPSNLLWSGLNYSFAEAGYHGVELDPPLAVTGGNDVVAVVKFTNASYEYPIPADSEGPHETQRTYLSCDGSGGSWYDLGTGEHEDVAIRLRTSGIAPTPTPTSTLTPTPTKTLTLTPTPTPTSTPTLTGTPPTATPTHTPTPTGTLTPPAIGIYLPIIWKARPPVTPTPTPTPSWTIITAQDFEGSFPSSGWQVDDQSDEDGGEYAWGRRDCRAHNGSHSAWSVGGGDDGRRLSCGQDYRDNMDTWMIYGPFDLKGASAAALAFHFWNESEEDYDELFWGVSINDLDYYGEFRSGDWTEWEPVVFDLADWVGESQVWIGFSFWSDDAVAVGEGAFVDDVILRKMTGGQTVAPGERATASAPVAGDRQAARYGWRRKPGR